MKKRILPFALIALLGLSAGCLKSKQEDATPVVQPQGTFSGQFTRYHYNRINNSVDSLKISLSLLLSSSNFSVGGDTTKHAGSHGTFQYDNTYLTFADNTVPATNTTPVTLLPKIHLIGSYVYAYDGITLQLRASNDTLIYYYNLKKSN
ncbi:hypothetical protein HH214_02265 [Mucilaginibacter robiniae]|uniref:Lipoprotein n=1 Tax=Mucilaginibacter robiniae TaxID=2728022 RepID=A0A7L5DUQ0_9SPHI|nr:hypothetical protein [Mucilaginibacter robiniae]QJD94782.1 hypothetical protein HH214_02265 [Mucilaginibacter robiniae]